MKVFFPAERLTFDSAMAELSRFRVFLEAASGDDIEVDLRDVMTCDAAGLAFLVEIKKASAVKNTLCRLQGGTSAVLAYMQFFGMDDVLRT